jgi:hypothetical protein
MHHAFDVAQRTAMPVTLRVLVGVPEEVPRNWISIFKSVNVSSARLYQKPSRKHARSSRIPYVGTLFVFRDNFFPASGREFSAFVVTGRCRTA